MINKHGYDSDAATGVSRSLNVPSQSGSPDATSGAGMCSRQTRSRLRESLRVWGAVLVLTSLALEVVGCNGWFRPVEWANLGPQKKEQKSPFRVIPRKNQQLATLSPDDIVRIMQRVGFADEQVMELGTELHNALRFEGAAVIVYRKDTLAIFAADGDFIRIQSRSGSFDYEISKGQFVSAPRNNW